MEAYKLGIIKDPQVHVLKSIIKTPQMDVEVDLGLQGVARHRPESPAFTGPPNKGLTRFLRTHTPSTINGILREASSLFVHCSGAWFLCRTLILPTESRVCVENPQKSTYKETI